MITLIFTFIEVVITAFCVDLMIDHIISKTGMFWIIMGIVSITDIISTLIERYKK